MALTLSVDQVDENGREKLTYGTEDFPIAFFDDDLTRVSVPFHWHDEWEIVLITEGIVRIRIAGRSFVLKAGEGYFVNSGVLHSAVLASPAGHQHALVFSPRIISQKEDLVWRCCVSPILGQPLLPFLRLSPAVPWQREILRLAESAWVQGAYEKQDYPLGVRECLTGALALMKNNLDGLEHEFGAMDPYQRDELRIKKALVFIEKNYDAAVTMAKIAQSAAISASTCLRLFRTILNTTPIQYLMQYRLQKAAEALKQSHGKSIADIAYACGFSDASYFNRCFRKEYGMTPSAFRAKQTAKTASEGSETALS